MKLLPLVLGGLVLTLFTYYYWPDLGVWSLLGVALVVVCVTVYLTSLALGRRSCSREK